MAAKKSAAAKATPKPRNPDAFEFDLEKNTKSQALAHLATNSTLAAVTVKFYSTSGDADLEVRDLVSEMKKAGSEAVAGDLGRVERMLVSQMLALDAMFNNMAQRAFRQETYKGIEVLMRLGLKAQAQARATAEALAVIKNPMPYIRQANIAQGHQQVNNGQAGLSDQYARARIYAGAGNSESAPNKLLEADHGQRLDTGAQAAASRADQALAAVGEVHRAEVA